jgi:hypothetical protein
VAYIDGTFLDNTFGSTNVTALCPTTTERDAVITMAEAAVYSALYNAGYQTDSAPADVTTSTVSDTVQLLTYRVWLELAHLRNQKSIPATLDLVLPKPSDLEKDGPGRLEIPGLTKNTARAVGGVSTTDVTSDREDGGREAVFSGDKMTGWF